MITKLDPHSAPPPPPEKKKIGGEASVIHHCLSMGIILHILKTVVSTDQNFRGSCSMSQNAGACTFFSSI